MSTPNSGDIAIEWPALFLDSDFVFEDNDLKQDDGLTTAVIISLFTDKRAAADDILPGDLDESFPDRRGWWGDLLAPDVPGDQIGSKLWLLERSKTVDEVIALTELYVFDALQWMIDDGIIVDVDIEPEIERQGSAGNDILAIKISLKKSDGTDLALNFETIWNGVPN